MMNICLNGSGVALPTDHNEMRSGEKKRYSLYIMETLLRPYKYGY